MLTNTATLIKLFSLSFVVYLLASCGSSSEDNSTVIVQQPLPVVEQITLPITTPYRLTDEINPQQAIAEMAIGINLGNTFDAPNEGDWALHAQEAFIIAFKDAGFNHVRIPVTWHEHTQLEAPYEVDSVFLTRVEEVVDWALAQGLYVTLNAHHESWFKENYQDQKNKNRLDSIWIQIAAHFKEKPAKLMFELLNEPNGMTVEEVNEVNKRLLSIIRNENPNRLAIFSGHGFTPIDSLLETEIPDVQDKFLIGNFHSYDPWEFAGQCQKSWGTNEDKSKLRQIYQRASDWATINQIPVMVNEFGVAKFDFTQPENICDLAERLAYLSHHVSLAKEFGIAATFWDDGGSFSTYDRTNNTWGPEKDILVNLNSE
ncbi:glycoside hydrolase family 5 protein [Colwellia piezophila]|uniref:glycoside hydrolase family 5 protein n=1 Tax=Colwellia piezophila TaxID=211668 RepID=UPI000368A3AB|nr:glycoside hydrolase family 5 protein [Colwellia piezophila]